jgi:DNA-binding NarL/FixJ family response regulator
MKLLIVDDHSLVRAGLRRLHRKEYLAMIQARFAAADADRGGTVSAADLASPAGKRRRGGTE